MPLPIQTSSDPEASVKSLGHHQQTSDKPIANQEDTRPKWCFGCVLRSELCRGASVALSMDMANATGVIWVDEHTQEVAQASRWLYLTARMVHTAKMLFWVRFVFRALSWHVRGTFCGYGQRDLGFPTLESDSDRCEGLTLSASATSP